MGEYRDPMRLTIFHTDPPPCDEFTTRDPGFNAARVRQPGTMSISSPTRMYGLRSTWRGSKVTLRLTSTYETPLGDRRLSSRTR